MWLADFSLKLSPLPSPFQSASVLSPSPSPLPASTPAPPLTLSLGAWQIDQEDLPIYVGSAAGFLLLVAVVLAVTTWRCCVAPSPVAANANANAANAAAAAKEKSDGESNVRRQCLIVQRGPLRVFFSWQALLEF